MDPGGTTKSITSRSWRVCSRSRGKNAKFADLRTPHAGAARTATLRILKKTKLNPRVALPTPARRALQLGGKACNIERHALLHSPHRRGAHCNRIASQPQAHAGQGRGEGMFVCLARYRPSWAICWAPLGKLGLDRCELPMLLWLHDERREGTQVQARPRPLEGSEGNRYRDCAR